MIFEGYVDPYLFSDGGWLMFLILGIVISLHIILSVWVYIDAKKRVKINRRFWITIVALTGILGFIAYLMKTRQSKTITETS